MAQKRTPFRRGACPISSFAGCRHTWIPNSGGYASEIADREKQKNMEDRSASNGGDADEYAARESEPEDWR